MALIPEERGYRDVRRSNAPMVDYPVPVGPQPPTQYYGGSSYGQLGPLGVDPRHIGSVSAHNDPYHSTMSAVSVNGAVGPVVSYYSRDPHVLWAPSVPDPMLLLDKFMSTGYGADPRFVSAMGNVARDLGKPIKSGGAAASGGSRAASRAAAQPQGGKPVSDTPKKTVEGVPNNAAGGGGGGFVVETPRETGVPFTVFTDSANDGGAGAAYVIHGDGTVELSPDVQDRADAIKSAINWFSGLFGSKDKSPATLSEASTPHPVTPVQPQQQVPVQPQQQVPVQPQLEPLPRFLADMYPEGHPDHDKMAADYDRMVRSYRGLKALMSGELREDPSTYPSYDEQLIYLPRDIDNFKAALRDASRGIVRGMARGGRATMRSFGIDLPDVYGIDLPERNSGRTSTPTVVGKLR